jgi:hypothetical protein
MKVQSISRRLTQGLLFFTSFTLVIVACEVTLPEDRTPPATVGTTVFAAVRWGTQDRAIDIVFVPDAGYGDLSNTTNRQTFLDDVANEIDEGYWQNNAYTSNLGKFNFWYMWTTGTISAPTTGICPTMTWPSLTDASFAEMVILLHRNTAIRDCGGGARASSLAGGGNEWIIVHEAGHAVFGLPDEYCCDGGYFSISPILYNSEEACANDAANADWRDCQSFTANSGTVWWRSEGDINDLMVGVGPPVFEVGEADWVIMRNVLSGLGGSVNDPSVFAPNPWDWP